MLKINHTFQENVTMLKNTRASLADVKQLSTATLPGKRVPIACPVSMQGFIRQNRMVGLEVN